MQKIASFNMMNENFRNSIGDRLREERDRLTLSQEDFAALGGVSKRTQAAWEKGEQVPNAEFLGILATHGVDVLYVITGQHTPTAANSLTVEEKALVDNYQHADEEGRAAARRVLSCLAQQKAA